MVYKMCSLRDRVVNEFMEPRAYQNLEVAVRDFKRLINNNETFVKEDDLSLWYIADFDTESGEVTYLKPVYVNTASDFRGNNDEV